MVYIDKAKIPYRGMLMAHMIADTLEELHAMASFLGVRRYFQDKPGKPHYDICQANKRKAIAAGAIEIDGRELIMKLRKFRT